MGLLDGVIGGAVGAGLTSVIGNLIEKQGGVAGIAKQFEQKGLGETVKSWIGTGANNPVSAEQISQVLGNDTLQELASKLGLSTDVIAQKLSELLPTTIDQLTPNGNIPQNTSTAA